ncbi:alpha/beta hydrolase [Algoriphagus machipongonensis]|uniref:Lipase, putative esterase n=1 Tax=Algoriphagus machipongonensis TaxID=388413 RepID=A3HTI5_9BACT|nr:alpha/beta hydrolase [Algoriphagus machipongonensis]EAZ83153.1 lipase, putative esterase [Algoriphagus machipongonensis]
MITKSVLILCFFCSTFQIGFAQEIIPYKEVDTTKLYMEVIYPENMQEEESYPAMVFFFGGGWVNGARSQFEHQADYLAKRGIVCFLVDYRIKSQHQTTPFESLKDAKSAIRFIRKNASEYGINPHQIIAAGGSAGGHLAAATALSQGFNESTDQLDISPVPNALVLFNPVIDNGPGGYGYERIGEAYPSFSPLHNIRAGAPPTLFLLGTNDNLIPVVTAEYYQMVMEKVGSRCDLILYENQPHGFFNYRNFEFYQKTVQATDDFLQSLGYLEKEPKVEIK